MKNITRRFISSVLIVMMVFTLLENLGGKAQAAKPGFYRITYSNGGDNTITNLPSPNYVDMPSGVQFSIPVSLATNPPKKAGYRLDGYYEASNPSKLYQPGQVVIQNVQKNYTILMKFTKITPGVCHIKFEADGGSGVPANFDVPAGVKFSIPSNKPTKSKFLFLGWSTTANSITAMYAPGAALTTSSNMTLYPVWAKNQFATCNDEPGPSKYKLNNYTTTNHTGTLYVGSEGFMARGWVIHDRGVKSFSYKIVNNQTGKTSDTGSVSLKRDVEAALLKQRQKFQNNNGFAWTTDCVRYEGFVSTKNLSYGDYTLWIIGTTNDGNTFNAAKIPFTINKEVLIRVFKYKSDTNPIWEKVYPYNTKVSTSTFDNAIIGISPTNACRPGYTRKWYDKKTTVLISPTFWAQNSIDLYYENAINTCNIKFVGSDGKTSLGTVTLKTGDVISQVLLEKGIQAEKKGYVFVGWSTDRTFNNVYDPNHMCIFNSSSSSSTYYAMYIEAGKSREVKYKLNYYDLEEKYRAHEILLNKYEDSESSLSMINKIIEKGKLIVGCGVSVVVALVAGTVTGGTGTPLVLITIGGYLSGKWADGDGEIQDLTDAKTRLNVAKSDVETYRRLYTSTAVGEEKYILYQITCPEDKNKAYKLSDYEIIAIKQIYD